MRPWILIGVSLSVSCAAPTSGARSSDGLTPTNAYEQRLSGLEERVERVAADAQSSQVRVQEVIDVLQAELAKTPEPALREPEPSARPAPDLIALANVALGVADEPVTRDGNTITVDRAWFARKLLDLVNATQRPTLSSYRSGGVRLRGIRAKSFLAQLGFRNGDVVLSINGALVNTPAGVSREIATLREIVDVVVQRRQDENTYRFAWKASSR
ncbi:MAG: S1C family serine protease [Myxococcota bacterium]